jgi:hypothetical protein
LSESGSRKLRAFRAQLSESLFPDSPKPTQPNGRAWRVGLALTLLAAGVVLQLLRLGWSVSLNSLWAEDGSIFLHDALTQSFSHTVFAPYANYMVVVPRLIAEGASLPALQDAPVAISVLSAMVVSLSGLAVWFATAGHIRNPYLRATLATLTVLVPVSGLESLDSAAYVPWYMLFATFWILLWRPGTLVGTALASLFVFATALSSPGVWFFSPLAALRAIAIRDRRDIAIVSSFTLGAVIQIPVVALNHQQVYDPAWTNDILTAYLQRVLSGAAFGQHLGGSAWAHLGWPFLVILFLCTAAGLIIGLRRSNPGTRYLAAVAIPTSFAMFLVSLYQRAVGTEMVWPAGTYNGTAGRYVIVPALLLVSVAVVLVDARSRSKARPGRASWLWGGTIALLWIGIATSFDMRNIAARGIPAWDDALRSAAKSCAAQKRPEAEIAISPTQLGFLVQLPCDRIASFNSQDSSHRRVPTRSFGSPTR